MQTIVFNSQKGGSGKTTLCAHLAVEAERAGDGPVYLIDTDPQGSLTMWHEDRQALYPQRVVCAFAEVEAMLDRLREEGARYVFIDTVPTRPGVSLMGELLALADLVVVPSRASKLDIDANKVTLDALTKRHQKFLIVMNQVKHHSKLTAQAVAAASHFGPVAETLIADRVAYAAAVSDGRSAAELAPRGPAAEELKALWTHIRAQMPPPGHRVRKEA